MINLTATTRGGSCLDWIRIRFGQPIESHYNHSNIILRASCQSFRGEEAAQFLRTHLSMEIDHVHSFLVRDSVPQPVTRQNNVVVVLCERDLFDKCYIRHEIVLLLGSLIHAVTQRTTNSQVGENTIANDHATRFTDALFL